jgi:hypothetical protein
MIQDNTELVTPSNAGLRKYYGVLIAAEKGFITRDNYERGQFVVRAISFLTKGNGWDDYDSDTLQEVCSQLIFKKNRVYQFDDEFELMAWLAEPTKFDCGGKIIFD